MTDEKIIQLYFCRDEDALRFLDAKYGARLRAFGNRMTSDKEATEECVDDTYMKSWQTIPPKNPKDKLFAYLSKILRNICLDRYRASTRKKRDSRITSISSELAEALPSASQTDSEIMREELSFFIEKFVRGLPTASREIFVLRYFYAMDIKQIAKEKSITSGNVKTILKRTRDKLKLFLESYEYHVT